MGLDITMTQTGDLCEMVLAGDIDVYTAMKLKHELISRIESGCVNVIVDMGGVVFIDSSGLGVLLGALRRAREREGTVRIVCTRDSVLKLFRITGLDKVFPIFSDITETRQL